MFIVLCPLRAVAVPCNMATCNRESLGTAIQHLRAWGLSHALLHLFSGDKETSPAGFRARLGLNGETMDGSVL